jgi:CheY-like chemotaxis protein
MNREGRILVMDDEARWRDALSDVLQRSGYHVDTAASTKEALELLSRDFYHLLVLDIRMQDFDASNVEGMDILQTLEAHGLAAAVEVIILSAYGTKQQMRSAFKDYDVADFQAKDEFDDVAFADTVRQVFAERVRINLGLAVHWQGISNAEQVVANLDLAGKRVKHDQATHKRATAELDDLLCRMFHDAESVLLRPVAPGYGGTGVLWAQPFYASAAGQPVIIKFGDFGKIEQEHSNFEAYVKPFVGGRRSTTVLNLGRTPLLGGIAYSLLGAAGDRLLDFASFYRQANIDQIKSLLDHLFFDTCGTWYASLGKLQPYDLTAQYEQALRFTYEGLEEALSERLKSVQGKTKLQFKSLPDNRSFINPILAARGQHLLRSTYFCITHGDFNENNILIDNTGRPWLIDFFRTGPGHILRDVAELDSIVRLQLVAPEEAPLEERLRMEETLAGCEQFSQVEQLGEAFVTDSPALQKAYATVAHLRHIAHRLVEHNPADDIGEYFIALFYYALNTLRFYSLPVLQREHALLSASLLADRLGL